MTAGRDECDRDSEPLFREMANDLPLIVWVHGPDGEQQMVNDTFCEYFGVTREEMTGGRWQVLMHADDADAYAEAFLAATRERRPFHHEVRVQRGDGQWRWLESWARPRFAPDGGFLGMLGASADVTERKRSEQQLDAANRRIETQHAQLQAVYDAISDGLMVFDADGNALLVNEAEARLCGYADTGEMMRGLDYFREVFELTELDGTPLPFERWPVARVLRGERLAPLELCARRRDTGRQWVISFSGEPIPEVGGQALAVLVSRDVTARHRDDELRRRAAARDRFRARLEDALRPLNAPDRIQAEAARALGEHLGANRVLYADISDDLQDAVVRADYHDGLPSAVGRHRLDDYAPVAGALRSGSLIVVEDVCSDARLGPQQRSRAGKLGVRAYAAVPLFKADRPVAVLAVHFAQPHCWDDDETALVEEVAERTWSAVGRALAEAALRASEQRYRTLLESIDQGFCVIEVLYDDSGKGIDYRFLETNAAFERHSGLSAARGRTIREMVEGFDDVWPEIYGEVARSDQPRQFVQQAEALGRWFEVSASAVGDPAEHKVAVLFSDITERRRTEQALRDSEHRFRMLADNMTQLAWIADGDGAIVWYNRRWNEFSGEAASPAEDRDWRELCHPDHVDRVAERLARSFRDGTPWEDTFPLRGRDGEYRWFLCRAQPIRGDGGRDVVRWFGTHTDVTEQREAEQRLRESDRRKDEYLAMLGHELRNPLAAIRSATELFAASAPADPALRRATEVLQRQSSHMSRLVQGLLEMSRILRGKISLAREQVDLRDIVGTALEDRAAEFAQHGLALQRDLAPAVLPVDGDRVRLAQVIDNLLGNAIKFTPAGGAVEVSAHAAEGTAVVRVSDTGIGIGPEQLAQIFQPFHQGPQDAARATGGLGLGLALARELAQLHGGSIEAASPGAGQGAQFTLRLPLASLPTQAEPGARRASAVDRQPQCRVLIVEDNEDAAQMLSLLLQANGQQTSVSADGHQALRQLRNAPHDVVLCDIGLPGISGYEFARMVRADPALQRVPLVALTGYGQPEDRRRAHEAGFDRHLVKPVDIDALLDVLGCLCAASAGSGAAPTPP